MALHKCTVQEAHCAPSISLFAELRAVVGSAGPYLVHPLSSVAKEDLFDMLDVDGKGEISQIEFADGLLNLLTLLG